MQIVRCISRLLHAFGFRKTENSSGDSAENVPEIPPEELEKKLSEGWQQGTLLSLDSSRVLRSSDATANEHLVIATQTCDLLHHSLKLEPTVELLTAEILDEPVPKSAGKSFRSYELALGNCADKHVHIKARPRIEIDRQLLFQEGQKNELQIETRGIRWFSRWLGEKYTRPAFPNAFDHKLARYKSKIAKAVEKLDSCRGMYLTLSSWSELPDDQTYSVVILLLMRHNSNDAEQQAAETALGKICDLMTKAGHQVEDAETRVILENKISVRDFTRFQKWSLDYISLRNPEHEEPPAAG